jgi:hypothetical protein
MQPTIDFGTILLYVISFLITVFLIRWIFRIDRILANLDKQYAVTKLIAEKLGVDELDIKKIDDFEEYKRLKRIREDEE